MIVRYLFVVAFYQRIFPRFTTFALFYTLSQVVLIIDVAL